jgi:hypothetical protein
MDPTPAPVSMNKNRVTTVKPLPMERWIFQEREKRGMQGESEKITPTRSNTFSAADRQDFSKK